MARRRPNVMSIDGSGLVERSRRVVASFDNYAAAQKAVDHLSDKRFPVERLSIVADDISFVEEVTGRVGYGRAALNGSLSGAAVGVFFGFIFGLFSLIDPLVSGILLAFYGLIFGVILGALLGILGHWLSGGQRDFSSVGGMRASRYDVMADEDVADEVERLIADLRVSERN